MRMYRRYPILVDARQVTRKNAAEVARWCQCDELSWNNEGAPEIVILTGCGWDFAYEGDWIIKEDNKLRILTNSLFKAKYEEVEI